MRVATWPPRGRPPDSWRSAWPVVIVVIVTMSVIVVGVASAADSALAAGVQASTGVAALCVALLGLRERSARVA